MKVSALRLFAFIGSSKANKNSEGHSGRVFFRPSEFSFPGCPKGGKKEVEAMAQEAIAFAAPRAEEMTRLVTAGAGAGITGAVEGVIVKMAPALGALEPVFTWGALLGVPAMAAAGALFTRGMLGDLFQGMACGGLGVVGYSLPEMLAPITGRKAPGQGQLGAGAGVKQLPAGPLGAPARAQAAVRSSVEF